MENQEKQKAALRSYLNAERLSVVDANVDDSLKQLFQKIRLMIRNVDNQNRFQKHQSDIGQIIGDAEQTIHRMEDAIQRVIFNNYKKNGTVEVQLLMDNFDNFKSDFRRDADALLNSPSEKIQKVIEEHVDLNEWQKSMQARSHDLIRSLQDILASQAKDLGINEVTDKQEEIRNKITNITESALTERTREQDEKKAKRREAAQKGQETTRQRIVNEQQASDDDQASEDESEPHRTKWQSAKEKISDWRQKGVDFAKKSLEKGKTKTKDWRNNHGPEFIRHKVSKKLKERQSNDRSGLTQQLTCLAVLLADEEQHKYLPSQLSPGIIATKREIRCRISPAIRDGKYGGIMEAIVQMCINERHVNRDRRRSVEDMVNDILEGAERLATTKITNAKGESFGAKYDDEKNLLAAFASVTGENGQEISPQIKDFAATLQKEKDTNSETETGGIWGFFKNQAKGIFAYTGLDTFINPVIEKITALIPESLQRKKKPKKPKIPKNPNHLRFGKKPPNR